MLVRDEVSVTRRWRLVIGTVVVVATVLVATVVASQRDEAAAHGTMQSPPSRIYYCRFNDSPDAPSTPACRDAVAAGGSQAVYDWNEVNVPNAAGNHRAVIPDGQLCSAGRQKYRGFDQPRADWPATQLTAGAPYAFKLNGSAAHQGAVELYITRDGYDPTRPLRWDDLEPSPFLTIHGHHAGAAYEATAPLPAGKTGRHLIYAIWQRTDSPEAFYACSDVVFDGGSAGVPAGDGTPDVQSAPSDLGRYEQQNHAGHGGPTPDSQSVPSTSATHVHSTHTNSAGSAAFTTGSDATSWSANVSYEVGARVLFDGRLYSARQAHTSIPGWEPPVVPALWEAVAPQTGVAGTWTPNATYAIGAHVTYAGVQYRCVQGHTSLVGWEPPAVPALWQPVS